MTTAEPTTSWEPPGPGFWQWQGSHLPGVPTPIYRDVHQHTLPTAMAGMFERYGVPLRTMDEAFVNGRMYTSLQPLIGRAGAKPPPTPILWLATRMHPEFRRRNKAAARALARREWRTRAEAWRATLRPGLRRANLALQAEDLGTLDDAALGEHLQRVHQHVVDGHLLHFDLHGDDIGPLGLFLCACREWGIDAGEGIPALTGHSPSTMAAVEALRKVAIAYAAAEPRPATPLTLDELRATASGVADALDEYLEEYGWRLVTGYDLDAKSVAEMPEVLLANVLSLTAEPDVDTTATGHAAALVLRDRVPEADRARFDELLDEARIALDLRDDNGPMTVEWPVGLLRRALLEVGRRAVSRGALDDAEHAVELTLDEVDAVLAGETGPGAAAVSDRAAARAVQSAVTPPAALGTPEALPDLRAFPKALATMTDLAVTVVSLFERSDPASGGPDVPTGGDHHGLGVGTDAYRGRARVAHTAEEALALLEPGEVLVVPFTTPAYNAVLAMAGGLVTEEGGTLSHAAVLARELSLPSVIGVAGALRTIAGGAQVEVDPVAGTVRVVD